MATLKIKYLATSIQMQMHLLVFLPESVASEIVEMPRDRLKVLWLLHGEGGDCSDWTRLSMIEHYAQEANIALVMPNIDNSMYMDMAHGGYPYFTYLMEDLPRHVRNLVQILSDKAEDNFVAGISTGGYGAVKWVLRDPEMFSGCACLSGDIDIVSALRKKEEEGKLSDDWTAAFGSASRIANTTDDNLFLIKQLVEKEGSLPSIFLSYSEHDDGFVGNRQAVHNLHMQGVDIQCYEEPSQHGWPFWNARIKNFIDTVVNPVHSNGGKNVAT